MVVYYIVITSEYTVHAYANKIKRCNISRCIYIFTGNPYTVNYFFVNFNPVACCNYPLREKFYILVLHLYNVFAACNLNVFAIPVWANRNFILLTCKRYAVKYFFVYQIRFSCGLLLANIAIPAPDIIVCFGHYNFLPSTFNL